LSAEPEAGILSLVLSQPEVSPVDRRPVVERRAPEGDGSAEQGLLGLFGLPFIDLEPLLPSIDWAALHEEICLGLAQVPLDYTGGSHRSMGIMPPSRAGEVVTDYGEVIRGLDAASFETFRSLSDDPSAIDAAKRAELEFGEERSVPLSRRQMAWLKIRFGVYFPWKGYLELIPNRTWGDKANAAGKRFTRIAEAFFPRTIAFVSSLPFVEIGRCNIMGVEAFDHGTVHRDGHPEEQTEPDPFISFCPAADKTLYLWDEASQVEHPVAARAYWFNDFDYHGVRPSPFFRYSVRVDGPFEPAFLERIKAHARSH
jgi:hypothetical protein